MIRFTVEFGLVLVIVSLVPFVGEAQDRVKSFDRLDGPRITLPDDPEGASEMRQLCPESTETCQRYWAYTGYFVRNATIPTRDREVIILRTAWLNRGDYIWGRHNIIGQEAGLTEEEINRVTQGSDAVGWNPFDAALVRAVDELHTSRFLSEATWSTLGERYTESQLREVVLIVGNYTQLSMFQNALGAQLEPGIEGLPSGTR
tara:strand:+ start:1149 stop:1757 length:609 start_codon:yes stop_codon:yes gene_type:complete